MNRCLQLASCGAGAVAPNPMVGAVLVRDGLIVGEGFHSAFGQLHAEVVAIADFLKKHPESELADCTLYVNLEPCAHHGKTPPCAEMIVQRGIKTVVTGIEDPNPNVAGKGFDMLESAGVSVIKGVLATECEALNRRFTTFQRQKRPYIILKWAQTADGFISTMHPENRTENLISCSEAQRLVHKWRSEEQAILVGAGTVIADNPHLTVRLWHGKNPVRIILSDGRTLPANSNVFSQDAETFIIEAKNQLSVILDELHRRQLLSVLVEGGTKTLQRFIDTGLWDEARVFTTGKWFGKGVKAPLFSANIDHQVAVGGDRLILFKNLHGTIAESK